MSTPRLTLPAPAKLNRFLHITGRREDGYHTLQTVFHLLDQGDELDFALRRDGRLMLSTQVPELRGEDNLVLRAARALQETSGTRLGADITLRKRLPLGGGLGGGSSDAATTLLALNRLWDCRLSSDALADIALTLGADVPVFVHGRSAWAENVGEQLTPLTLPAAWFVVLTPPCRVGTREIFCHEELTRDTPAIKIPAFPVSESKNDCERVARSLYPEIGEALDWLEQFAPARMTGTGASIFAEVESEAIASRILAGKPDRIAGFVAQGVNYSPVHQRLKDGLE